MLTEQKIIDPSQLTISANTPQHRKQLLRIERECFKDPWSANDFKDMEGDTNSHSAIMQQQSKNGTIVLGYVFCYKEDNIWRIINLAVDPAYRLQKVGTELIRWAISRLLTKKRMYLVANVRETNEAANQFFVHTGFICTATDRDYYDNIQDESSLRFVFNRYAALL